MKRQRKLMHRIYLDEKDLSKYILTECSPAKKRVVYRRTSAHVKNGKQGATVGCMNSLAGMDNKDSFPHPVFLIEFTPTSCFVVDKVRKGGIPTHCVWYKHNDRLGIEIHDVLGPAAIKAWNGKVEKTLVLRPPPVRVGISRKAAPVARTQDAGSIRKQATPVGAKKRANDAGIPFA